MYILQSQKIDRLEQALATQMLQLALNDCGHLPPKVMTKIDEIKSCPAHHIKSELSFHH